MADHPLTTVLRLARRAAAVGGTGGLSDGQLLERFVALRDEAAFEALLCRHAPMVLGVCRRLLSHGHDAEDAFQATFLVLAHRARSIARRESVGSWLYGVAYRTALKARTETARRPRRAPLVDFPATSAVGDLAWQELCEALDEEVNRLAPRHRAPVVLCYFENKTYAEAARELGLAAGTVASRLARARALLRRRLLRRGLTLSAGLLGTLLAQNALGAVVHTTLVRTTLQRVGSGVGALVSAPVTALTNGVLKTMLLTKLKIATALVVAAAVAGGGATLFVRAAPAAVEDRAVADGDKKPDAAAQIQALRKELDQARQEIAQLKRALGQAQEDRRPRPLLYRGKPAGFWVEQLNDGDPSYRLEAVRVLGIAAARDPKLIKPLLRMLHDEEDRVRVAATHSLGQAGTAALPALTARLKEQEPVRSLAAVALGDIGPEAECAVPALVDVLRAQDTRAREAAADALGKIGPRAKAALPDLVQALKKTRDNRQVIGQAIARIDPSTQKALPTYAFRSDLMINVTQLESTWADAIRELEKKYPAKPRR
jgi:RNA polymerase sigma factor (sigma-70 family)